MLNLTIIVPANRTSPSVPQNTQTEGDDTPAPAEEVPVSSKAPDSGGADQFTEPEHPLPPPDFLPVQSHTPIKQDQGDIEKARIGLDRADEVTKLVDRPNAWEGVVGRIKWLMDTLSPVAEVRVIFVLPFVVD
jgi:hypothetical protein